VPSPVGGLVACPQKKNQFCAKNYAILSKFWYFFPILQQKVGDYPPFLKVGDLYPPVLPCSDAYAGTNSCPLSLNHRDKYNAMHLAFQKLKSGMRLKHATTKNLQQGVESSSHL